MEKVIKIVALRRRQMRPGTRAAYRPSLPIGSECWDEIGKPMAI